MDISIDKRNFIDKAPHSLATILKSLEYVEGCVELGDFDSALENLEFNLDMAQWSVMKSVFKSEIHAGLLFVSAVDRLVISLKTKDQQRFDRILPFVKAFGAQTRLPWSGDCS